MESDIDWIKERVETPPNTIVEYLTPSDQPTTNVLVYLKNRLKHPEIMIIKKPTLIQT